MGGRGSPIFPPGIIPIQVFVTSPDSFPAPIANVITLLPNRVYTIHGVITMPAGVRFICPTTTTLLGRQSIVDQLIGDVNAAFVTFSDSAAANAYIRLLLVHNNNTGSSAAAVEVNIPNGIMVIESATVRGMKNGLLFTAATTLTGDSVILMGANGGDAVRVTALNPNGSIAVSRTRFDSDGSGAAGIRIPTGTSLGILSLSQCTLIPRHASSYGISLEGTGVVTSARITALANRGIGVTNNGWSQATPEWVISESIALPDSVYGGGSIIPGAAASLSISLSPSGTWFDVSQSAVNSYALSNSERFSLFSQVTGEIQYIGKETRKFLALGVISIKASATPYLTGVAVTVNNSVITDSESVADNTNRISRQATLPILITLSTNDKVKVQVRSRETPIGSATVSASGLSVVSL